MHLAVDDEASTGIYNATVKISLRHVDHARNVFALLDELAHFQLYFAVFVHYYFYF